MGITQSKPLPQYDEKIQNLSGDLDDMSISREKACDSDGYAHGGDGGDNVVDDDTTTPAYTPTGVSLSLAKRWENGLVKDPKNRLAISALSTNPIPSVLSNPSATVADTQTFNVKIPLEGSPITNQRSSGRCWLFASTNVFRVAIMKRYNLKDFELSQSYLFFWDKIEKANWFLEKIIETASLDLDGRLVQELLKDPVSDGGQWDMLANLVKKYGIVPQALYPDSYNAKSSSKMNWLVTVKLREQALILREMATNRVQTQVLAVAKEKFLQEIHSVVTICLGLPPDPQERFNWEYYDADGKFHRVSLSPLEFAGSLSTKQGTQACGGVDVQGLFSLVNDPRNEYERLLTIDKLGNVIGGRPITYVNVGMDKIKSAAISMLKEGHPIFFGCDVGKFSDSTTGIMDTDLYDFPLGFNNLSFSNKMNKVSRIQTGESAMTHAMVLTAVHLDENDNPVRWRVQNSWGENAGDKGWFVMTDRWMDQFVYQVVVDGRFVGREVRDVLRQEAKVLPRWDPMGILA